MTHSADRLPPRMNERYARVATDHDIVLSGEVFGDTNPARMGDEVAADLREDKYLAAKRSGVFDCGPTVRDTVVRAGQSVVSAPVRLRR